MRQWHIVCSFAKHLAGADVNIAVTLNGICDMLKKISKLK